MSSDFYIRVYVDGEELKSGSRTLESEENICTTFLAEQDIPATVCTTLTIRGSKAEIPENSEVTGTYFGLKFTAKVVAKVVVSERAISLGGLWRCDITMLVSFDLEQLN